MRISDPLWRKICQKLINFEKDQQLMSEPDSYVEDPAKSRPNQLQWEIQIGCVFRVLTNQLTGSSLKQKVSISRNRR